MIGLFFKISFSKRTDCFILRPNVGFHRDDVVHLNLSDIFLKRLKGLSKQPDHNTKARFDTPNLLLSVKNNVRQTVVKKKSLVGILLAC